MIMWVCVKIQGLILIHCVKKNEIIGSSTWQMHRLFQKVFHWKRIVIKKRLHSSFNFFRWNHLQTLSLWQYGFWSFQAGGTKLERFLHKNQHTQRKLLKFEFWINGELSKSAQIWLSKSIFYVKNHGNLSQFHWRISI